MKKEKETSPITEEFFDNHLQPVNDSTNVFIDADSGAIFTLETNHFTGERFLKRQNFGARKKGSLSERFKI